MPSQIAHPKSNFFYYFTIIFIIALGIATTVYIWITINNSIRERLIDRAETLAAIMDVDKIKSLKGDAEDLSNPNYMVLKKDLAQIVRVNHDLRFIYLMRKDGQKVIFLADSEDPNSADYSAPGDEFPEASGVMLSVFDNNTGYEISPDRWGWWISGFAPIVDAGGNTVALIGIDIPAYENIATVVVYSALPLLVTLLILLFIVASHNMQLKDRRYVEQKAEFLSIASHEIRSPLTGIKWATELIMKGQMDPDRTKATIITIHDNASELIRRIGYMLDTDVRDSEDLKRYSMQQANLSQIVGDVVKTLTLTASAKNVQIEIDSSIDESPTLCCNYESMRQMLANLISNAVKYTKPDSKVKIWHTFDNLIHRIYIRDEGNGISKKDISLIFKGYRTKSAIESEEYGNGLGLYFSQKIASLHNGKIEVESEEGRGSTFILTLKC